jgi:hypothetical protein
VGIAAEVDPASPNKPGPVDDQAQVPDFVELHSKQNFVDYTVFHTDFNDLALGGVNDFGKVNVAVAVDLCLKAGVIAIPGLDAAKVGLEPLRETDFNVVEVHGRRISRNRVTRQAPETKMTPLLVIVMGARRSNEMPWPYCPPRDFKVSFNSLRVVIC